MAYDGWMEFGDKEFVNLARTTQLAEILGITSLWTDPASVAWIQDDLAETDYDDITTAPWYDPGYPASAEFAGIVPISVPNLDDSTLTSTPIEYIGDGGHSGLPRNAVLPLVWSVAIIASTDRGADYGKRWMDRRLKDCGSRVFCTGVDLRYFRYASPGAPKAHRRDVKLTRGSSVTRKKRESCSVTWWVTFTMTCADPYEYGEPDFKVSAVGSGSPIGPNLIGSGAGGDTEESCPAYDYSPIFDPLYPAMVPSPTAPDFYPDGWNAPVGREFFRYWVRFPPVEPTDLLAVPILTLSTSIDARMVRVAIWDDEWSNGDQCDPLFMAIISYLPAGQQFIIDGEQKASYVWDGFSPSVRRTDSLVYGANAGPVEWTAFNDPGSLHISLDIFKRDPADGTGYEGSETVRAALSLVPKSD